MYLFGAAFASVVYLKLYLASALSCNSLGISLLGCFCMLIKRLAPRGGNGLFVADAFSCVLDITFSSVQRVCKMKFCSRRLHVAAAFARRVVLYVAARRALGRTRGAGCRIGRNGSRY